jgi:hypothetical protein
VSDCSLLSVLKVGYRGLSTVIAIVAMVAVARSKDDGLCTHCGGISRRPLTSASMVPLSEAMTRERMTSITQVVGGTWGGGGVGVRVTSELCEEGTTQEKHKINTGATQGQHRSNTGATQGQHRGNTGAT